MTKALKAISIRQPWTELVVAGEKLVENRSRNSNYRGLLVIHAGKKRHENWRAAEKLSGRMFMELDMGGIVGVVEMVDVVSSARELKPALRRWYYGEYGYVLRNARRLPFIPCPGQVGIFSLPASVCEQIRL